MKLLMRKVDNSTGENVPAESEEKAEEEQQPKKIRNRPLFHVKVIFMYLCSHKSETQP